MSLNIEAGGPIRIRILARCYCFEYTCVCVYRQIFSHIYELTFTIQQL